MRKTVVSGFVLVFVVLCYFTILSAWQVFRPDWEMPLKTDGEDAKRRIVLITQELETPFWQKVGMAAKLQAEAEEINLEIWGSYGKNQVDFLEAMEVAIASKVDGIIVQGLDVEEFHYLTKSKAALHGIPVITVADDVPQAESMRRSYVGSNQFRAGQMIARQMLTDLRGKGAVLVLGDRRQGYSQRQRIQGIEDVLKALPGIKVMYAETSEQREQVVRTTREMMNRYPVLDAFIPVNANIAGVMLQEISRRAPLSSFRIYTFDDGQESYPLFESGKIDGMIAQDPAMMGKVSVQRIMEWLNGQTVPLDQNGYETPVRLLKAVKRK